jgi:LysM repeat protein
VNKDGIEMNTKKTQYRIKSRIRFTIFVAILMMLLVTGSNTVLGLDNASSLTIPEYAQVQIVAGDTLWDIASRYIQEGNDIRKFVYEICELNKITADSIHPGQSILVPVYS